MSTTLHVCSGRDALLTLEKKTKEKKRKKVPVRRQHSGLTLLKICKKSKTLKFFVLFSRAASSFAGNLLGTTVQHRQKAKQGPYGTTVPLQLVGKDWNPISKLKPQVSHNRRLTKQIPDLRKSFDNHRPLQKG